MKIKIKEPEKKYDYKFCEACGKYKICTWHHIGHRRYDERWMWLCVYNLVEEGCHEKVHRDTEWAYEQGFLVKHNTKYMEKKEKKQNKCEHSKMYFDAKRNYFKCNFCGKKLEGVVYD